MANRLHIQRQTQRQIQEQPLDNDVNAVLLGSRLLHNRNTNTGQTWQAACLRMIFYYVDDCDGDVDDFEVDYMNLNSLVT